jgi:excinuclease ABC subunit C
MDNKLKFIFSTAPDKTGVYLMRDSFGKVIYIGKAKSLKKRLLTYLGRDLSLKTQAMLSKVCKVDFKLCANESMALLLEAGLVHKYKPKYNIALRDDKSFPVVRITNECFPSVQITRKRVNDGSLYFGPYTNSKLLKEAMKTIRKNFPYFASNHNSKEARFDQSIGLAPSKDMPRREYLRRINIISLILQGRLEDLLKKISKEMQKRSDKMDFEEAAKLRDQIAALRVINSNNVTGVDFRFKGLEALKRILKLKRLPLRIEAFDVSNISGKEASGSMVSFYSGRPDKTNYRRFRIKGVSGVNDYLMLREVVRRRYLRLLKYSIPLPDLIIIDGGKGHLQSAQRELELLGLDIPMLSIAKERENVYIKGRRRYIRLNRYPFALNLIRRIRDEAHRFAIAYHHLLRRKAVIKR